MACCATCPCHTEPGLLCLSIVNPRVYGYFAERCRLDESTEYNRIMRKSVLDRSRIAFSSADELRKVLAPISGGADGTCNCNCGKICVTCNSTTTSITVKQGGTILYTGALVAGCTPPVFGKGSYTVETVEAGGGTNSETVSIPFGTCDTGTAIGVKGRSPTLDPASIPNITIPVDSTPLHNAPPFEVTVTGIAPSIDVPLTGNTNPCSGGAGGTLSILLTLTGGTLPAIGYNQIYTSPNTTGTLQFHSTVAGFATFKLSVSQSNVLSNLCCVNTKDYFFTVTVA